MVLVGAYRRAGDLICLDECGTARRLLDDARSRSEDRLGHADAPTLSTWGICISSPGSPLPGLVIATGRVLRRGHAQPSLRQPGASPDVSGAAGWRARKGRPTPKE
jgi:hypothetical protein